MDIYKLCRMSVFVTSSALDIDRVGKPSLMFNFLFSRRVLNHLQKEREFPASRVGTVDELCLHFASVAERRPGNCLLRHSGRIE